MILREVVKTSLFSLLYIHECCSIYMERDKLKLIVRNLKLLVDALESEVFSDPEAYTFKDDYVPPLADYDEVFEDDE